MSPEYQAILQEADQLQQEYKKQPCHLERLYGNLLCVYVSEYARENDNSVSSTNGSILSGRHRPNPHILIFLYHFVLRRLSFDSWDGGFFTGVFPSVGRSVKKVDWHFFLPQLFQAHRSIRHPRNQLTVASGKMFIVISGRHVGDINPLKSDPYINKKNF